MMFALLTFGQQGLALPDLTSDTGCTGLPTAVSIEFNLSNNCTLLNYKITLCNNNKFNCTESGNAILNVEVAPFVFVPITIGIPNIVKGCQTWSSAILFEGPAEVAYASDLIFMGENIYSGGFIDAECE